MNNLTEDQRRVFVAAIECAISAPTKQPKATFAAKVKWSAVNELRDALEACGIDWKKVKREELERD